jgi:hypothetical protein
MLSEIMYFEKAGRHNAEETLEIARKHADEMGIKSVVVASTTGYTAEMAAKAFKGLNIVVVTHVSSFKEPEAQEFPSDLRKRLESRGVKVVTAAHTFSGINRLINGSIGEIVTKTLRLFCEGFKVAVEIAAMSADAGLVRIDEDIVSVAGTGSGADTALVIRPSISRRLFEMKVKKILAKPIM